MHQTSPISVIVRDDQFLRALSNLIAELGEAETELFIGWLALQEVAPLVSKHLAEAVSIGLTGKTDMVDEEKSSRCLTLIEKLLGWVTFVPYVLSEATPSIRRELQGLADNITRALRDSVNESSWLGPSTLAFIPDMAEHTFMK